MWHIRSGRIIAQRNILLGLWPDDALCAADRGLSVLVLMLRKYDMTRGGD